MKRKLLALGLALVMCLSMSMTALAASSSTSNNSSSTTTSNSGSVVVVPTVPAADEVVATLPAGGAITPTKVNVAFTLPNGVVAAVSLNTVIEDKKAEVAEVFKAPTQTSISAILTTPASDFFNATVKALAEMKGSEAVVNNCGSVKTVAVAKDALGNTIASAGVVKNVTSGALILLMSINEDGTIEYVEGVVDPVTGAVLGAFDGTPSIITVLVLA